MRRRHTLLLAAASSFGTVALSACQGGNASAGPTPTPQKRDVKTVAASLQAKTVAMIDAVGSNNQQRITQAKTELDAEARRAEEDLKSETGAAANRTNAAADRIRRALIANNDLALLNQARDLLQQAQA
jgi:hypothetical protein